MLTLGSLSERFDDRWMMEEGPQQAIFPLGALFALGSFVFFLAAPSVVASRRMAKLSATGWIAPWPFWAMRIHKAYRFEESNAVKVAVTLPARIKPGARWRAAAAWRCPATQVAPTTNFRDPGKARPMRDTSQPFRRSSALEARVREALGNDAVAAVLVNGDWSYVLVSGATSTSSAHRRLLAATAMNAWNVWPVLAAAPNDASAPRYDAVRVRDMADTFLSMSKPLTATLSLVDLEGAAVREERGEAQ